MWFNNQHLGPDEKRGSGIGMGRLRHEGLMLSTLRVIQTAEGQDFFEIHRVAEALAGVVDQEENVARWSMRRACGG